MNTIIQYYRLAELALAAYSKLIPNMARDLFVTALKDGGKGMADAQANDFVDNWRVIDQYDGMVEETYVDEFGDEQTFLNPTGLSVTLFEDKETGKQVVAIRGTDDLDDFVTDLFDIALLGTTEYQAQYAALSAKVKAWKDAGILQAGFSVTGHSLGGFLATGLTAEFGALIDHTYLYNSPGLDGLTGPPAVEILKALLVPTTTVDVSKITNIQSDTSLSPISGTGDPVVEPTLVYIENQWAVTDPASPAYNHSVRPITDALALYNLFAQVDSNLTLDTITGILKASSSHAENTLESALSALGGIFGEMYPHAETTRDVYYINLDDLQKVIQGQVYIGALGTTGIDGTFTPFSPTEIESLARTDIAYRYALVNGNPFAVLGADYSKFNQSGELDIYDPATGKGQLTNMYLADRAEMLANWLYANANDFLESNSDSLYVDMAKDVSLNEVLISPSKKFVFGSELDEVLKGTKRLLTDNYIDRLYGMDGNDTLDGLGGDDYLGLPEHYSSC